DALPILLRAAEISRELPASTERDIRLLTAIEQRTANPQLGSTLELWRKRGVPLLAGNWSSGLAMNAELMLGTASMPVSPQGRRYADIVELTNDGPLLLVSGMADAGTPGLAALRALPPAMQLPRFAATARNSGATPLIGNSISAVVVGSRPSGLPPGLATQAELLALQAAGLPPYQVLHAATGAGATALGLGAELGRIATGARADLLLVAGDPLNNVADSAQVIAVVKDGRFLSVASLLERVSLSRVD
ncbi:MAG: amidohydrolase family protein, partial [Woeseia sp.]